jgi:alpha-N-acetylglucosaminidase
MVAQRLPAQDRAAATRSVATRLLGARAGEFDLEWIPAADGHEVYEISASGGRVNVKGSSGVAVSRGVYHYLREACDAMVTWSGRRLAPPSRFPDFAPTRQVCPYRFVQYYNVCAFGYTTPFWDWPRWERELDWMALHGINMPLAMDGQEAIWQRVWKSVGLSQAELDRFSTGPAHLPWHRMGNINNLAGPLPQGWIEQKRALQGKILERMRALGMKPIVPAFSGFVPEGFKRLYPRVETFTSIWNAQMPREARTFILHPGETELYQEIGKRFIQEYKKEFGEVEYYLADTFNEVKAPVTPEHRYQELAQFARTVYDAILAGDPDGTWVMQGWLFESDAKFWDNPSIQAFLSGIPDDRIIILDYANDAEGRNKQPPWTGRNQWKLHESYFGKQWINGMIHTMGGNNNVKGNLPLIASQPAEALASPAKRNLVGWGMDPEGIEQNEVVYELMTDIGWAGHGIDLGAWIPHYCTARYGGYPSAMEEAWRLLLASAYSWQTWGSKHTWQARPSLTPRTANVDVSPAFQQAVERFLSCAGELKSSQLYRHDLIELVAQSAGGSVDRSLAAACEAHRAGQAEARDRKAAEALEMLVRIDGLMHLRPDRRLETWTESARSWGTAPDEAAYYEANGRRLITFWGGSGLNDYASRVWSGLIRDYYVGRWRAFFQGLKENAPVSLDIWEETWLASPYRPSAPHPVTDLVSEARQILDTCKEWERGA